MQPSSEKLIHTRGANVFARQFGSAGKDIVVIHGGPGWDHSYFLPFVLPLAEKFRLTFFDLRGCGRSEIKPGNPNPAQSYIDGVVDDFPDIVSDLGVRSASILGFSFGGRIAMKLAETHSHLFDRLILASTTAYSDYHHELESWPEYQDRMPIQLKEEIGSLWNRAGDSNGNVTRKLAQLTLPLNIYQATNLEKAAAVLARVKFTDLWHEGSSWEKSKADSQRNYAESLKNLKKPLLILHGEKDMVFPLAVAKRGHAEVEGSQLIVLPGVGHLAHIESPQAWCEAVGLFCGEQI